MNKRTNSIQKVLSRNDTGETGGHQAGILIPKKEGILSFFPALDGDEKNPRLKIAFHDHLGEEWSFSFIYYNNRFFGGTRNEYRLTGMTRYMKAYGLKSGDTIVLSREDGGFYTVKHSKNNGAERPDGTLKLGNSWKVVRI